MPVSTATFVGNDAVLARLGRSPAQFAMSNTSTGLSPELISFALTPRAPHVPRADQGVSIVPLRLSASRQSLTGMRQ